jgi:hypothetical protein
MVDSRLTSAGADSGKQQCACRARRAAWRAARRPTTAPALARQRSGRTADPARGRFAPPSRYRSVRRADETVDPMDMLIDLLLLLSPAIIGLLCIAAGSVAPMFKKRR